MDFSDVGGNMKHGAHIASIGGTWLALVYGFAGMRDHGGRISFRPCLPSQWTALRFSLVIREACLHIEVKQDRTRYQLKKGDGLTIRHADEEIVLTALSPAVCRPNPRLPAEEPASDLQPSGSLPRSDEADVAIGSGLPPRQG